MILYLVTLFVVQVQLLVLLFTQYSFIYTPIILQALLSRKNFHEFTLIWK